MAIADYKFDDIVLPPPPLYVIGETMDYLTVKIPQYHKTQYAALLDFMSAVQQGFLINSDQVISLDADKITNNTQFTQNLYVGAESKITIDGNNNVLKVDDNQGTPVTRVYLGKLSSATNDYGLKVIDASGAVKFQTGATTYIEGGIIKANTVDTSQIAADAITADEIAANAVTAAAINVSNLSSVSADIGACTAGTLTGGTIQTAASGARVNMTTDGINGYNSRGTQTIDIANDGTFRFGPSGGNNIYWNNSALSVTGAIVTTGNITEGQITGRATVSPNTILLNNSSGTIAGSAADVTVTAGETSVGNITLECVGRDILIVFNPELAWADLHGIPTANNWTLGYATFRVRRDSASGTIIATSTHVAGGRAFPTGGGTYNSGGSMMAFDAGSNVNGSLASPADQTYHVTVQIDAFTVGGVTLSPGNKQKVTCTGLGVACELRA